MVMEVTCRTVHGRFLLAPSSQLNRLVVGVLARAQRRYEVQIHAYCFMSNHYHLLLTVENALQLARFMNFVQSNVAREAGRLAKWGERFWGRRYQAILVSDESEAQLARLRYVLSQGCKEGLVRRTEDWPGAQCVRQLLNGETQIRGQWIDRTALYKASHRGAPVDASHFTTEELLVLSPLPCLRSLNVKDQRDWIAQCVDQIATEARRERVDRGYGRPRDLTAGRAPHSQKRSPAPWFHVASASVAHQLRAAYALFIAMYRSAAEKLKRGLDPYFPEGCFPPARPYIPLQCSTA